MLLAVQLVRRVTTLCLPSSSLSQDVTGEEFVQFVDMLSGTQTGRTVSGHQQVLQLVQEQLDPADQLDLSDTESHDKLLLCVRQAIRFVSVSGGTVRTGAGGAADKCDRD